MTNLFLKAKHWQLFLLMFGVPMFFYFIWIFVFIASLNSSGGRPEVGGMVAGMVLYAIIMLLVMFITYGWHWAVGVGLQSKIPEHLRMKTKFFRFTFFFPLIYMLIFFSFMGFSVTNMIGHENDPSLFGITFLAIVPLHLFAMFCSLYNLYFVSKTIKTVELQKELSFSDYAGEFFMIWFFFVGVWILQPKINEYVEENNETPELDVV